MPHWVSDEMMEEASRGQVAMKNASLGQLSYEIDEGSLTGSVSDEMMKEASLG